MRAVSDFVIGNTAVRIVDTGRRIRVIDVEKQQVKKQFRKVAAATLFAATLTLGSSLSLINQQNSQTLLNKQVFSLKSEINRLEKENQCLAKSIEENEIPYHVIYKKATALGMHFPKQSRIKEYNYKKGSGIKIYK